MNFNDMQALSFEIQNLHDKVEIYSKNKDYVYTDVYKSWIVEYNHLLDKYNALANLNITHMSFNTHDLSSTQKTVRNTTIEFFLNNLSNLIKRLHHIKCVNVLN